MSCSSATHPRHRRGLTLLELMVVIVIIGLLSGAVTLSVRSYLIRGKQTVAKMEITNIAQAIETYYAAYDSYPASDQGLEVLTKPTTEFAAGLLPKIPLDPWGHPYEYLQPGRIGPYEVICYGADGQDGGEGADRDITSDDLDEEKSRPAGEVP